MRRGRDGVGGCSLNHSVIWPVGGAEKVIPLCANTAGIRTSPRLSSPVVGARVELSLCRGAGGGIFVEHSPVRNCATTNRIDMKRCL